MKPGIAVLTKKKKGFWKTALHESGVDVLDILYRGSRGLLTTIGEKGSRRQ